MKLLIFKILCFLFPSGYSCSKWKEDLIWCPSQLTLKIHCRSNYYVVYLRWRWQDPWAADLIPTPSNFDEHDKNFEWINITDAYFMDSEYKKAEKYYFKKAFKHIKL